MAFDILGCAKSALRPGPDRSVHFTPYGAAGAKYVLRSHLDAEKVSRAIRSFCMFGSLLVAGFLATFVFKSRVYLLVLVAVFIWLVAYWIWARGITQSLERVN